jgi:MoaA/NifB/PqqE/SkfB family radical SAM enzyme
LSTLLDAARLEVQQHLHRVRVLPIIVVYLNNVCDSQCITCSIWKNNDLLKMPSQRQMPDAMLEELYAALGSWRPRQILISGGEPVLHPRFADAVKRFLDVASTVCVTTNGLLLSTCEPAVLESVSEFYISFDAPDAEAYRKIRGVDGFARLTNSMKVLRQLRRRPKAIARCTLQRENVRQIPQLIAAARQIGFDAISFLGVDTSSNAFSRDVHGAGDVAAIQPTASDLSVMKRDLTSIDNADGFVEGGSERLTRILHYFRALLGEIQFPSVRCNAPWVSVVIETTGKIRGCFFQPEIGDFHSINGDAALRFRRELNVSTDSTCQRCVCSKFLGLQDFIGL